MKPKVILGVDVEDVEMISKPQINSSVPCGRNYAFDVMKCIAAFLVVCLHYAPKYNLFDAYLNSICRIAVPIFLIISGYYYEHLVAFRKLKRYIGRIILIACLSSLFYLMFYGIQHYLDGNLVQWLKSSFGWKSFYVWLIFNEFPVVWHVWYLYALLYSVIFNLIIDKLNLTKSLPFIALGLLLLHCVLNIQHSGIYLRNWVFLGIPFLTIGRLFFCKEDLLIQTNITKKIVILGVISTLCLLYIEMLILPYRDLYFFAIPLAIILSLIAVKYPSLGKNSIFTRIGRVYSQDVYLYHVLVGTLMLSLVEVNNIYISYLLPVLIFVVTLVICSAIKHIKSQINRFIYHCEK